jgi:hypothetical protein
MDLRSEDIVDCTGRVTHRLRLRLDGQVEITDARHNRAVIDPINAVCLTPGMSVSPHVMGIAVSMGSLGLRSL